MQGNYRRVTGTIITDIYNYNLIIRFTPARNIVLKYE